MRPYLATALHWLHQIGLALWLGGILMVGAVTAPAVFGSARRAGDTQPGTPLYDFASTVMTVIFERFNWVVLAAGVLMLLQPFVLWAFTWSFLVTLVGTVMFIVVSHFPD